MTKINSFNVVCDKGSDVLYIIKTDAPAARGKEDSYGVVWRYDGDGNLLGATVMDAYDRWHDDRKTLATRISDQFHIPTQQADVVLDHAFEA